MVKKKISLLKIEFFEDLNPGIKFEQLSKSTRETIKWKCEHGHEWESKVSTRLRNKKNRDDITMCPVCYNKSRRSDDLSFLNKFFDKEKNEYESIDYYTKRGNDEIWWACKRGHSYKKTLNNIFLPLSRVY